MAPGSEPEVSVFAMRPSSSQLAHKARILQEARRVVVKIGSSVLSDRGGVHAARLDELARDLSRLSAGGMQLVVVTSGAVAAGMGRLNMHRRPRTIPGKQAAAAVGQITLMALYEAGFSRHGIHVAQVLLTHDDLANRRRYLNAKHTLLTLIDAQVVPIVNENDTVAVDEIRFGDNDTLSAQVAVLVEADLLIMLSDVAGLYETDPRVDTGAERIALVERFDEDLMAHGGVAGPLGRGGMASKLQAAQSAARFGIPSLLADGLRSGGVSAAFDPRREVGTLFLPLSGRIASRKHWIAYTLKPAGALRLDAGASVAIRRDGRSLLPAGVRDVVGSFEEGECVTCLDERGREFARGLVNYGAAALARIRGRQTAEIEATLGYKVSDEVIHRDDLALLGE